MALFPLDTPTGKISEQAYMEIALDVYKELEPHIVLPSLARNIVKYNLITYLIWYGDTNEMQDAFFEEFLYLFIEKD